jgi:hypothetical protein
VLAAAKHERSDRALRSRHQQHRELETRKGAARPDGHVHELQRADREVVGTEQPAEVEVSVVAGVPA